MATTISKVQDTRISHAVFIDLELGSNVYYISSAYQPITYNGNTYTELGAFLTMGDIQEDFKATNGDLAISLSGIPSNANYVSIVMGTQIKGGNVVVRRGFFDVDNLTLNSSDVYERYRGVITNYNIGEDTSFLTGELVNSVTITCASINTLLENRISGQRTNGTDRKKFYPGDISFDRVKDLMNTDFDFGKEYTGGQGYGGGGGPGGPGGPGRNFNQRK